MGSTIRGAAAEAGSSRVVETGARLGYAASGLLHLLLAWVALQMAWFGSTEEASQEGALRTLAGTAVGSALLWASVVGFALLAVWQVSELLVRRDLGDRVKSAARCVVYLALAWTAFDVVQGTSSGGADESGFTAALMGTTGGRLLVGAAGLVLIGVGVYHVFKGWTSRFLRDLRERPRTWVVRAGRFGYVAKGIALGAVGGLLLVGATGSSTAQEQGLDAALRTMLEVPAGKILLTVVALGFAAYGIYSFGRARHARV